MPTARAVLGAPLPSVLYWVPGAARRSGGTQAADGSRSKWPAPLGTGRKSFGHFCFITAFPGAGLCVSTHVSAADSLVSPLHPARKLISISFGDLNPFPLRQIRNRRAYHLEKVRLELTELEAIREDFLRERDTSPDKGELVSDEEEDT
ncbi:uncharacterized protein LOC113219897 [Piliocolobus tephrosceles]|uniref:uncharacterized protein LOC113219897 n=1 Tax=Piliocolobus tephrosceles TaxID=591936 RepID=UPI000E6B0370|nr:uncharacterized protein LOC113219897 [Piliocolobus tephrosceles]